MTKWNQTVREWLEERRKSVEDLSLQIIDQKQARIDELEEENKKLKKDLTETQKIGESWRQECKQLREELNWWKDLVHKAKEFEYDEDGMDYIWQNTKNL